MNFQLNVYGAPWSSNAGEQAIDFANTALANGHTISRIFFFFDAVYHGLNTQSPASDEYSALPHWQAIAEQGVPLMLCIAACANRGVLSEAEAKRYDKTNTTIAPIFEVTGLGQWASGFLDAERIISFK